MLHGEEIEAKIATLQRRHQYGRCQPIIGVEAKALNVNLGSEGAHLLINSLNTTYFNALKHLFAPHNDKRFVADCANNQQRVRWVAVGQTSWMIGLPLLDHQH
jgi:hypothetical protein